MAASRTAKTFGPMVIGRKSAAGITETQVRDGLEQDLLSFDKLFTAEQARIV